MLEGLFLADLYSVALGIFRFDVTTGGVVEFPGDVFDSSCGFPGHFSFCEGSEFLCCFFVIGVCLGLCKGFEEGVPVFAALFFDSFVIGAGDFELYLYLGRGRKGVGDVEAFA